LPYIVSHCDKLPLLDHFGDLNDRNFDVCLAYCIESLSLNHTPARIDAICDCIVSFPPRVSAYNLVSGLIADSTSSSISPREKLLGPFLARQSRNLQLEYGDCSAEPDAAGKAVGLVC
jgi:hypothetical protein